MVEVVDSPDLVLFYLSFVYDSFALNGLVTIFLVDHYPDRFYQVHLPLSDVLTFDCPKEADLFLGCFDHDRIQGITLQIKQLRSARLFLLVQNRLSVSHSSREVDHWRSGMDLEVYRGCG